MAPIATTAMKQTIHIKREAKKNTNASEVTNKHSSTILTISINNHFAPAALPRKLVCNGLSWWTKKYVELAATI